MKKLLLIVPLILTACGTFYEPEENRELICNFEQICSHSEGSWHFNYLRDIDTNIIYLNYICAYKGSVSIYYNSKGEPMTYEEFKLVHIEKYH